MLTVALLQTASQCYATHTELPPHEQVTDEQDALYLSPYVREVEREDYDRVNYWQ